MAAWRRLARIWRLEVTQEAGIDARHFLPGRVQQNGWGWHLRNRNHQMSEGAGQEGGSAAPNTSPGNLSCPGFPPAFGRADEHGRHFSLNLTLHLLEGCSTCEVLQHPVRRGREREDEWAWDGGMSGSRIWRNLWERSDFTGFGPLLTNSFFHFFHPRGSAHGVLAHILKKILSINSRRFSLAVAHRISLEYRSFLLYS